MSKVIKKSRSTLERLPNELKNAIFAALPDVQSLRCAILAGRELYFSIKADEANLVGQILNHQIQRGVLEDAVTVQEAKLAENKKWDLQRIDDLFKRYSNRTDLLLRTCDLPRALKLASFHRKIEALSKRLADQNLNLASKKYLRENPVQVANQTELTRVQRAFYRFELYCVLFGDAKTRTIQPESGQREAFWDHYAPWEIEQVACVYEHIQLKISPVFENLALTVPDWTEYASASGVLTLVHDEFLQAQMTRGLEYVYMITISKNGTTQNYSILPPEIGERCFDMDSIEVSLNNAIDLGIWPAYCTLHEMEQNPEEAGKIIKLPFSKDLDAGPETAWRWAHRDASPDFLERSGFVLSDAQTRLREHGYVFWDRARLEHWGLLNNPWEGPDPVEISDQREQKVAEFGRKLEETTQDLIKAGIILRGFFL